MDRRYRMTREKANNVLLWVLYKVMLYNDDNPYCTPPNADEQKQAIKMAKDALNAIDEIRAEIVEYKDDKIIHAERNEMIDIVLDIVDKYRAESEDKNETNN